MAQALERPEWLDDPRFKSARLRQENIDDRLNLTQSVLRTRSSAEWLARLEAADVPCAPVLRRRDMIEHPQVLANDIVVELEHPQAGPLRQARPAARFSATPLDLSAGAPLLGADTETVLRAVGYDAAALAQLRADGVIGPGAT